MNETIMDILNWFMEHPRGLVKIEHNRHHTGYMDVVFIEDHRGLSKQDRRGYLRKTPDFPVGQHTVAELYSRTNLWTWLEFSQFYTRNRERFTV